MAHSSELHIHVHVQGPEGEKIIVVPCGQGNQTLRWLGHVGIARYDEEEYQGWVKLGVPISMKNSHDQTLNLNEKINGDGGPDRLHHGDHVYVKSSSYHVESDNEDDDAPPVRN